MIPKPFSSSVNVGMGSASGPCAESASSLDWTLILGRRHLERVLYAYVGHYNRGRPHRSLDLATPEVRESTRGSVRGRIGLVRRDALGGLIHEYELAA